MVKVALVWGSSGQRLSGCSWHSGPSWASRALFIIELIVCSFRCRCRLEPFDVVEPLEKEKGGREEAKAGETKGVS